MKDLLVAEFKEYEYVKSSYMNFIVEFINIPSSVSARHVCELSMELASAI
jgi:hypothetical protein